MEDVKAYLLSICTAALVCVIVQKLLPEKGAASAIGKMMTGLFLTISVLQPLGHDRLNRRFDFDFQNQAQYAVAEGKTQAAKAMAELIKERTRTYILEKAASPHISVEVSVSGDDLPVPNGVRIGGAVSPYERQRLTQIIVQQLGIPEENLKWT